MNVVYIIRGPSGSGKSTYAEELSSVVYSADDFFMVDGKYNWDISLLSEAHQHCFNSFLYAIKNKVEKIVVANTFTRKYEYVNYILVAQMFGYEVKVVDFIVKDIETIKVLAERNQHGVPLETIFSQVARFELHDGAETIQVCLKSNPVKNFNLRIDSLRERRKEVGLTPYAKYQNDLKEMKEIHKQKEMELLEQLKKEREKCDHKWEFVHSLFYAIGETANGMKCLLCGAERHLNSKEREKYED
jgi:predicted kinase